MQNKNTVTAKLPIVLSLVNVCFILQWDTFVHVVGCIASY